MRVSTKLSLSAALLLTTVTPSLAFFQCDVPEIDGPAGISALALLVSAAMIAYNRARA